MFTVENHTQDMWIGDDMQGGSITSSVSGLSRSDLENFTPENVGRKKITPSGASSVSNGKLPSKTPGVMRSSDLLMRNGHAALPHEKAFSIQIGWRLFKLSGASINSDGRSYLLSNHVATAKIPRAPSYFSNYFEEQLRLDENGNGSTKTLFIDRDPETFADICRHLQGTFTKRAASHHFT